MSTAEKLGSALLTLQQAGPRGGGGPGQAGRANTAAATPPAPAHTHTTFFLDCRKVKK